MSSTLHIESDTGAQIHHCGRAVTIGRVKPNDLVIPDPKISRSHAMLREMVDGKYYLMDLGSANGSFVNGKRVAVPRELNDGDQIQLGNHKLVFHQTADTVPVDAGSSGPDFSSTMLTTSRSIDETVILVTDIRNFTPLSEQLSEEMLSEVLTLWFRSADTIVSNHGGTIDKFIGDAIMVRWVAEKGAFERTVVSTLKTAHELSVAVGTVNKTFPELPFPFKIGVGINMGRAILGNVGAMNRREYTAIGDAVNVAFRLETASKELGKDVVMGPNAYKRLPKGVWDNKLQTVTVKGKEEPIEVLAFLFDELPAVIASASGK